MIDSLENSDTQDLFGRIKGRFIDNDNSLEYRDVLSIKNNPYSLIQKGDGDIWNKYVDLGEQTDTEKLGTFDITNVKYKKTFELLTATSEDIKNKVINVSVSDENTEEDQNYNHQIKSELFKRIEFDIESFKQDLAKDSIKTMHKYNIYKGYDTLRVNISFNTGTS